VLSLEDVVERFESTFAPYLRTVDLYEVPDWLRQLKTRVPVRLIEAQRLLSLPGSEQADGAFASGRGRDHRSRQSLTPSVAAYSAELSALIGERREESGAISQPLDRSFPIRVVMEADSRNLEVTQLQDALAQLEDRRKELIRLGLLDEEQDAPVLRVPSEIDDTMRRVLSVYVGDTNQKLSIYEEISRRIEVFRNLVNERFIRKEMHVNREKGFYFINERGEELPIVGLSSGEQHQVVLLYELIFRTPAGSLVMIDEPELSLHVAWQERFLRDMKEIATVGSFDALIATHSPQIIGNRWDLTVELEWR
jgi:predicted ATP-binding protein involved in virulence